MGDCLSQQPVKKPLSRGSYVCKVCSKKNPGHTSKDCPSSQRLAKQFLEEELSQRNTSRLGFPSMLRRSSVRKQCRVPKCTESHSQHYCKICKDTNSNHFSSNCPKSQNWESSHDNQRLKFSPAIPSHPGKNEERRKIKRARICEHEDHSSASCSSGSVLYLRVEIKEFQQYLHLGSIPVRKGDLGEGIYFFSFHQKAQEAEKGSEQYKILKCRAEIGNVWRNAKRNSKSEFQNGHDSVFAQSDDKSENICIFSPKKICILGEKKEQSLQPISSPPFICCS